MKNTLRSVLLLIIFLALTNSISIFAQDWPQWRGTNRDGKVENFIPPLIWPAELDQQWKVDVGLGDSTPALVDDRLFVFTRQSSKEVILCIDAANGQEFWRDDYFVSPLSGPSAGMHSGPRSSPAVADGKVVYLGISGILSCNVISNGEVLWRKNVFRGAWPRYYTATSPIIVDGMVIAHLGKAGNGAIISFDLNTGREEWRWAEDGPSYSSPVQMTVDNIKQIVQMTERNIVGINIADGKLLWKIAFEPPSLGAFNSVTPIVEGQTVFFTGARRGSKAVRIAKQEDAFFTDELWSNDELSPEYTTPVLKDGFLYGMSDRGNLYCLDTKTGQTAWRDLESLDPSGFGTIIDAGSYMMVLTSNAQMIVYKPDVRRFDEIKRYKVADIDVYSSPVISGNRLFIKDIESLSLWLFE